ncbi:hypothetical protein AB0G29_11245 [Streptomyces parvus]|uniref:hypothetical protein n=1 Tax=Streptomyces parvus TaxID=66428 RepID=UPI0033F26A7A
MSVMSPGGDRNRKRGLAPLGDGLRPETAAFASYLRDMLTLAGATLAEAAEATGKDTSTVSRYCGGERVPELAWLRVFLLWVGRRGRVDAGAERRGRELLWAAARVKGPLVDRQFQLDRAAEELAAQRQEAEAALECLQEELDAERERCRLLEEQLHSERHAARARIEELEEHIRQSDAVLRLLQHDEERMADMIRETAEELTLWTAGDTSSGIRDEFAQLAVAPPDEVVSFIGELGREGKTAQARELLRVAADKRSPRESMTLIKELRAADRHTEVSQYREAIGRFRQADATAALVAAWRDPSNRDVVQEPFGVSPVGPAGDLAAILTATRERPRRDLQRLFEGLLRNDQVDAIPLILGEPGEIAYAPGLEGIQVLVAAWQAGCHVQVRSVFYRANHSQLTYIEMDLRSVQARREFAGDALDELLEYAEGARRLTMKGRVRSWVGLG